MGHISAMLPAITLKTAKYTDKSSFSMQVFLATRREACRYICEVNVMPYSVILSLYIVDEMDRIK